MFISQMHGTGGFVYPSELIRAYAFPIARTGTALATMFWNLNADCSSSWVHGHGCTGGPPGGWWGGGTIHVNKI